METENKNQVEKRYNLFSNIQSRKFISFILVLIIGIVLYIVSLKTANINAANFSKILDFLVYCLGVYITGNVSSGLTKKRKF